MNQDSTYRFQPEAPRLVGVFVCLVYGLITALSSAALLRPMGVPLVLGALPPLCAWLVAAIRAARMGLFIDSEGFTVRNVWRTRRFEWSQITKLGTRDIFLGTPNPAYVVGVRTSIQNVSPRRALFPIHVTYHKSINREMVLTRMKDEAERRGIEVDFQLE